MSGLGDLEPEWLLPESDEDSLVERGYMTEPEHGSQVRKNRNCLPPPIERYCSWKELRKFIDENCLEVPLSVKTRKSAVRKLSKLSTLAATKAARFFSFDDLELGYNLARRNFEKYQLNSAGSFHSADRRAESYELIPEKLFLSIIQACFVENEEELEFYSCLVNGDSEMFFRGKDLYRENLVTDVYQIGYHLSGKVAVSRTKSTVVSINIDRCRIVNCKCCNCHSNKWCGHILAVCLYRMLSPEKVLYRSNFRDSLSQMDNNDLKKLFLYFISELPRHHIRSAQQLIDVLRDKNSEISNMAGAPDPTDGEHEDFACWALDLKEISVRLENFFEHLRCPERSGICNVEQFSMDNIPALTSEWLRILFSYFTKEPKGMWNLFEMIRLMFARSDLNALRILRLITEEYLFRPAFIMYWYQVTLAETGEWSISPEAVFSGLVRYKPDGRVPHYCISRVYQEVIELWRICVMDPKISSAERSVVADLMLRYHLYTISVIKYDLSKEISNVFVMDANCQYLNWKNAVLSYVAFPGYLSVYNTCCYAWEKVICFLHPLACSMNIDLSKDYTRKFKSICKVPVVWDQFRTRGEDECQVLLKDILSTIPVKLDQGGKDICDDFFRSIDCALSVVERSFISRLDAHSYLIEGLENFGYNETAVIRAKYLAKLITKSLRTYVMALIAKETTIDDDDWSEFDDIIFRYKWYPAEMLSRSVYLYNILVKEPCHRSVCFNLAIMSLWVPRIAKKSSFDEVRTHHYESQLYASLRDTKVNEDEVVDLRKTAVEFLKFIETVKTSEAPIFPPVFFASYLFSVLLAKEPFLSDEITAKRIEERDIRPCDDYLALKIACEILNFDLSVSINEMYPMVFQRLTTQTIELAYELLIRYESNQDKLTIIIDRFLDPTVLKMFKFQSSNAAFFLCNNKVVGESLDFSRPRFPSFQDSPLWSECNAADGKCFCGDEVFQMKPLPEYKNSNPLSAPSDNDILMKRTGCSNRSALLEGEHNVEDEVNVPTNPSLLMDAQIRRVRTLNCQRFILDSRVYSLMALAKRLIEPSVMQAPKNVTICAFLISLFALGLSNKEKKRWRTRTFCNNASWVTLTAHDLGLVGSQIIEQVWENILTPTETISYLLTENAISGIEERAASANLAISVLRYSNILSIYEFERLIEVCASFGNDMLIKACFVAEAAGPLDPEIALCLVRQWRTANNAQKLSNMEISMENEKSNESRSVLQRNWDSIRETEIRWSIAQCLKHHPFYPNISTCLFSHSTMTAINLLSNLDPHASRNQLMQSGQPSNTWHTFDDISDTTKATSKALRISQSAPNLGNRYPLTNSAQLRMIACVKGDSIPPIVAPIVDSPDNLSLSQDGSNPKAVITGTRHYNETFPTSTHLVTADEKIASSTLTSLTDASTLSLIQANVVGVKALMSIERRQDKLDASFLASVQRSSFYLKDLRWLFDMAFEIGPIWAIEFCRVASRAILPPSTLFYLADHCINLNLKALPLNMEPIKLSIKSYLLTGVGLMDIRCVTPDIRILLVESGYSFPVVDLLQGCFEMLYIDASSKLVHCRMCQSLIDEVLSLIKIARNICDQLPCYHGRKVFDGFIRHIKSQKGCRTDLNKTIAEFLELNAV